MTGQHQLMDMGKMSPVGFVRTQQTKPRKFIAKYQGVELWHCIILGQFSEPGQAYLYNMDREEIACVDRHTIALDVYRVRSNVYLPE